MQLPQFCSNVNYIMDSLKEAPDWTVPTQMDIPMEDNVQIVVILVQ